MVWCHVRRSFCPLLAVHLPMRAVLSSLHILEYMQIDYLYQLCCVRLACPHRVLYLDESSCSSVLLLSTANDDLRCRCHNSNSAVTLIYSTFERIHFSPKRTWCGRIMYMLGRSRDCFPLSTLDNRVFTFSDRSSIIFLHHVFTLVLPSSIRFDSLPLSIIRAVRIHCSDS